MKLTITVELTPDLVIGAAARLLKAGKIPSRGAIIIECRKLATFYGGSYSFECESLSLKNAYQDKAIKVAQTVFPKIFI